MSSRRSHSCICSRTPAARRAPRAADRRRSRPGSPRYCPACSNWFRLISWGTTPRQTLGGGEVGVQTVAENLDLPEVLLTRDVTMPIAVVLPAPLGPSRAKKSPSSTCQIDAVQGPHAVGVGLDQVSNRECVHDRPFCPSGERQAKGGISSGRKLRRDAAANGAAANRPGPAESGRARRGASHRPSCARPAAAEAAGWG